jgi:hypothetical protein
VTDDTAAVPPSVSRDVVEASAVPQRHEVAVQRVFVVDVADLAEDQCPQRVLRHAPLPAEIDGFDRLAGSLHLRRLCRLGLLQRRLRGRLDLFWLGCLGHRLKRVLRLVGLLGSRLLRRRLLR